MTPNSGTAASAFVDCQEADPPVGLVDSTTFPEASTAAQYVDRGHEMALGDVARVERGDPPCSLPARRIGRGDDVARGVDGRAQRSAAGDGGELAGPVDIDERPRPRPSGGIGGAENVADVVNRDARRRVRARDPVDDVRLIDVRDRPRAGAARRVRRGHDVPGVVDRDAHRCGGTGHAVQRGVPVDVDERPRAGRRRSGRRRSRRSRRRRPRRTAPRTATRDRLQRVARVDVRGRPGRASPAGGSRRHDVAAPVDAAPRRAMPTGRPAPLRRCRCSSIRATAHAALPPVGLVEVIPFSNRVDRVRTRHRGRRPTSSAGCRRCRSAPGCAGRRVSRRQRRPRRVHRDA